MFDIEITYKTGNSFQVYAQEDTVGAMTEALEDAKENLNRIRQHYERSLESYEDGYEPLLLKTTDGERKWECPFWCGYFEKLIEARVVLVVAADKSDGLSYCPR